MERFGLETKTSAGKWTVQTEIGEIGGASYVQIESPVAPGEENRLPDANLDTRVAAHEVAILAGFHARRLCIEFDPRVRPDVERGAHAWQSG